jgi:hypothetical protein
MGFSWIKWLETGVAQKMLPKVAHADVQISSRRPRSVTGLKVKAKLLLAPTEVVTLDGFQLPSYIYRRVTGRHVSQQYEITLIVRDGQTYKRNFYKRCSHSL